MEIKPNFLNSNAMANELKPSLKYNMKYFKRCKPRKEKNKVILDLDETVISSKNFSELNDYKNSEYLTKNFKYRQKVTP